MAPSSARWIADIARAAHAYFDADDSAASFFGNFLLVLMVPGGFVFTKEDEMANAERVQLRLPLDRISEIAELLPEGGSVVERLSNGQEIEIVARWTCACGEAWADEPGHDRHAS